MATALVVAAASVVVEGSDDWVVLLTVCRFITISVGMSMVIDSAVEADVLLRVVIGSKHTSRSVAPVDVCKVAISLRSIQLAPTLSLSVKGKLKTLVSFSSTM